MLTELLTTKSFVNNIAANSPMKTYLESHTSTGWTPTTLLKRFLKGKPTLDARIASALGPKRVTSAVHGNHLLEISLDAPDPRLARATLRALVKEYFRQRAALARTALTSARQQVDAASATLAKARADLQAYTTAHPSLPPTDPERQTLTQAYRNGLVQLNSATSSMTQALGAISGGSGLESNLEIYDAPQLPTEPIAGKKRVVELAFVGAFVGALISFLAIMYLSRQGFSDSGPTAKPVRLHSPSPNGTDNGAEQGLSEHERARQMLAGETKNPFLTRRE